MKRIATPNRAIDMFGPGRDGFASSAPGVREPTYLSATFFNGIQEAVLRTIERADLIPTDDLDQFGDALTRLYGTFMRPGVGTVRQSIDSILSEHVSVSNFGARPDGTDHSAALSAAFNSGADEVWLPPGVFIGKGIVITSKKLKRITGPGSLKLADGANTFLLNTVGTVGLRIEVNIDGNMYRQSGATGPTRSDYILINLTDIRTVDTIFFGITITNAYFGAAVNNSGLRTIFIGCKFYDCGMALGTCDAIFNGTPGAAQGKILFCHIHNCTDYGVALDTTAMLVHGNTISNCFAGIGALTRGRITTHMLSENTISSCWRPIDYFNSAGDSSAANQFDDICVVRNRINDPNGDGGACISFAGNSPVLKLASNIKICDNHIDTSANIYSAIGVSSAASAHNTDVQISGNVQIGDNVSQNSHYATQVRNTDGLVMFGNSYQGVDLAISLTNCTGHCADTDFRVLRDAYGSIDNSVIEITAKFKNIPRRAIYGTNGANITCDVEFNGVGFGFHMNDDDGLLPSITLNIERLVVRGANGYILYADSALSHNVICYTEPVQITPITFNVLQPTWNIGVAAPSAGKWGQGMPGFQIRHQAGQPDGWRCQSAGEPGVWVVH